MPVNSFENYHMNWKPDKDKLKYPYYLSLAEQLESDIKLGNLRENAQLPPQRELADYLDINFSTVTRAYKLCEERGLIYATVGKGTFVSPHIRVQTSVVGSTDDAKDESYAILAEEITYTFQTLIPERTIYINGFSKSLSSGLRVAALAFPERFRMLLERGLFNLNLKTPSLNIEIAAELIRSQIYKEIMQKKRERAIIRNKYYQEIMGEFPHVIHPKSFYQWFPLPKNCTGRAFEEMMVLQGVIIYGSERFALGDTGNNYFIRIATSSPQDVAKLREGLQIIKAGCAGLNQKDSMMFIV